MLPQKIPASAEVPPLAGGVGDTLAIYLGFPERSLAAYERRAEMDYVQTLRSYVWHPIYAQVRKTERFKTLMRKVGLVDYWRAKGRPPQCHPTTGDDFVCE
jgi:hypothetical protein